MCRTWPTASFTSAFAVNNKAPALVNFDGSASVDPDVTIDTYEWDFGDGDTGTGVTTSHTYDDPGTYTATLEAVTDNQGAEGTTSQTITVVPNVAPVAEEDAGQPRPTARPSSPRPLRLRVGRLGRRRYRCQRRVARLGLR